jgi:hypothetical protein
VAKTAVERMRNTRLRRVARGLMQMHALWVHPDDAPTIVRVAADLAAKRARVLGAMGMVVDARGEGQASVDMRRLDDGGATMVPLVAAAPTQPGACGGGITGDRYAQLLAAAQAITGKL